MSAISLQDRIRGGLLGTIVGDALGVPVEFTGRSVRDRDPVTDMRGFGTWNQPPGTWSDDGSMTLITAEIFTLCGWDLKAVMEGFLDWFDHGKWTSHGKVIDIGNRTRNSLSLFRIDHDIANCGGDEETDNGNGSLMRCFPISAWLAGVSNIDRIRLAGEASALTHAHPRSRLCCAWHALWCELALSNDTRTATLKAGQRLRRDVPLEERTHLARILDGSILDLPREQVVSGGYVVSTLEASIWCLAQHQTFKDMVLAAVNLGGDTDTTGAVTGGMAGWMCGAQAIPEEWLAALPRREEIEHLAKSFSNRCLENWSHHEPL